MPFLFSKLGLALIAALALAGSIAVWQGQSAFTVGVTLNTNPDLQGGLLLWYPFDAKDLDLTPSTLTVISRTGALNSTLINFGDGRATTTPGAIGRALDFDGVNDYLASNDIGSTMTVSFWMRSATTTSGQTIIGLAGSELIETNSNGDITATGFPAATVYVDGSSASARIPDMRWHHVVVTDTTGVNSTAFTVGRANNTYFGGSLDDIRAYSRILSAEEVKRLYELGATTKINVPLPTNPDLNAGLIGHWTFDGRDYTASSTTGNTYFTDRSGNGIDLIGILNATVTPGVIGQAAFFDGSDDVLTAGAESHTNITVMTVAAWIKPTTVNVATGGYILSRSSGGVDWGLYKTAARPGFAVDFDVTNMACETANGTLVPNKWQHVVATWDGTGNCSTGVTLYVNGAPAAQSGSVNGADAISYVAGLVVAIGDLAAGANNFPGAIDDVRVYNRVLSAEEVKRLYHIGATTKINVPLDTNQNLQNGLIGWGTLDGNTQTGGGNQFQDMSTSDITLTATNFTASSTVPGVLGQAVFFDDTDDVIQDASNGSETITDNLAALSVSAWIRAKDLASTGGAKGIIVGKTTSGVSSGWRLETFNNNLRFLVAYSPTTLQSPTANNTLTNDKWYHVVATWDGTIDATNGVTLFINGVVAQKGTVVNGDGARVVDTAFLLAIGSFASGVATVDFSGTIDDVRLYNRVLSAEEAKRLYDLGR